MVLRLIRIDQRGEHIQPIPGVRGIKRRPPSRDTQPARTTARNFNRRCTQMHADKAETKRLSERIIGAASQVLNTLGAGLLEKVYKNALAHELRKAGLTVAQPPPSPSHTTA
jgi:hypothetical protein